jgi:hypothetical protein
MRDGFLWATDLRYALKLFPVTELVSLRHLTYELIALNRRTFSSVCHCLKSAGKLVPSVADAFAT